MKKLTILILIAIMFTAQTAFAEFSSHNIFYLSGLYAPSKILSVNSITHLQVKPVAKPVAQPKICYYVLKNPCEYEAI